MIYKTVTKLQKGKTVLYVARAIAVLTVISFYIPAFLLMGFSHTKALYRLKRLDYAYGVFGENAEYYKKLLPDRLPEVCEDYSFRTKGNMVAQDYHPSSYLIFRTDAAAIDLYSEHYRTLDCEVMISDGTSDEVKKDIDWVCGQMRLRETFQDDLDHAELYWFSGLYPKAVLLDRRSGLVAILT
ncbi:MAG: hypothetical protein IJ740_15095 [Ruminococcus sp.]|nr:hypothetical protein [Ruminococcus sp.]